MIKPPMKARGIRMEDITWSAVKTLAKRWKCRPSDVVRKAIAQLLGESG